MQQLSLDVFTLCNHLDPAKVLHICLPAADLEAIVVVDNAACGPAIGETRMAPDVSLAECPRHDADYIPGRDMGTDETPWPGSMMRSAAPWGCRANLEGFHSTGLVRRASASRPQRRQRRNSAGVALEGARVVIQGF